MTAGFFIVSGSGQGRDQAAPAQSPSASAHAATRSDGLVSVLIACHGQLEYTRLCVPSVLRHSRQPYELQFLETTGLDGTADYLAGVAAAAPVRVEVFRVPANPNQPTPAQEHVPVRGEFIVLLNNDTIVTEGWLDRLVAVASADPTTGMTAPLSNYAPAPLLVEQVPYQIRSRAGTTASADEGRTSLADQVEELHQFARAWREQHKGASFEADSLGGGCVLVKREVLRRIGLFPTRNALGAFDTEALSQRVRQAGYKLAACGDTFIHHFGSRSIAGK